MSTLMDSFGAWVRRRLCGGGNRRGSRPRDPFSEVQAVLQACAVECGTLVDRFLADEVERLLVDIEASGP